MGREDPQLKLRLSEQLKSRVTSAARRHNRSVNAEIVSILEDALDRDESAAEWQNEHEVGRWIAEETGDREDARGVLVSLPPSISFEQYAEALAASRRASDKAFHDVMRALGATFRSIDEADRKSAR
jgi:hypothetical protein